MLDMLKLVALLALLAAGSSGCESSHACSLVGCLDGVIVSFTGLGAHPSYDITITPVTTTPDVVPLATCTIDASDAGARQLTCTSSFETHDEFGLSVRIQDSTLQAIQISVSSDGTPVAQQTFDVSYQSSEINGPGCGVCTQASVSMTVP
jgi:hypothetical protein